MAKRKINIDLQGYITLAYLSAVMVGMMFDYQYYSRFEINIFEYSDILDFLLAPAKNLEVIMFVIGTLMLSYILFWLDKIWEKRLPKMHKFLNFGASKEFTQKYRPVVFILFSITYLFLAATLYGERRFNRFKESPQEISLIYQSSSKINSGKLIGKNSDYIFLETADSTVKAIPVNAEVQEIIVRPAASLQGN